MNSQRPSQAIHPLSKSALIDDLWSPHVIAEMNDYQFKVRIEGDFVWHRHADTDEAFYVMDGELRIDFRDGAVTLQAGDLYVVPKGIKHKPYAAQEVRLMLIEPKGVKNTGDEGGELTAENNRWI
ncbi:cupin domain-containing protein [Salinicola halimionae]|uniref:cupin domain-containing protein n=1 Tax=Salinicola halimionae TaxID=1949081 RepID=UPI000DA1CEF2|nr:cupin domain-containing protein [Salinicola halimionae]